MATWLDIIEKKLARQQEVNKLSQKQPESKSDGVFGCFIIIVIFIIASIIYNAFFDETTETFEGYEIGSELIYKTDFDGLEFYQRVDSTFEMTNTIPQSYFTDNSTDKIGVITDTIRASENLWLKFSMDKKLKSKYFVEDDLAPHFYIKVSDIK